MNDIILKSDRLYLKEFTDNDVEDYFQLNSDPEVMKHIGREPETDINVIRSSISKIIMDYVKYPGLGAWACFEKKTGYFIGFFVLAHLDNTDEIEVGYRLRKEYWGNGYATEMSKVLINYGFRNLELDEIVGITHPENIASQKVLIKSGLKYVKDAYYYNTDVKYYIIKNQFK